MANRSWASRPIFISSTFMDMQAERDCLRDFVFPELAEKLRSYRCFLEPVDLRWGVETLSISGQKDKELLVLKVCLDEIDRCRPFMIVLLGDRYGWVPPVEQAETAIGEKHFSTNVAGKSVTALEIEFGALASPEQQKRTFFYFREPLPYHEMDINTAAMFSDGHRQDNGGGEAYNNLQKLKSRISEKAGERVRHYSAEWDNKNRRVCGLEDFRKMVVEDIWNELANELREFEPKAAPTWQEQELDTLNDFIEEHSRNFIGRAAILGRLGNDALGNTAGQWCTVVAGAAGSGKSALFAKLAKDLADKDCLLLAGAAGISARSGNTGLLLTRWIGELCSLLSVKDDLPERSSFEDIRKRFSELLSQASAKKRVVCLIDALNQFENTVPAKYMTWLPDIWPQNAYLIATAIPGEQTEALAKRRGAAIVMLPALDENEARDIIKALCSYKTLNENITGSLISKKGTDGKPAYGNPLWLSIAVQELLLLDEDDFGRLGNYGGSNEEKLHALLKDTVTGLPETVEELYKFLLSRACRRFEGSFVSGLTGLIGISRSGFREKDMREILPAVTGEAWSDLQFALFRRYFRAHLVFKGNNGQWDFTHSQMRMCIMNGMDADRRKLLHGKTADYLETLGDADPLSESELMYHYMNAGECLRAADYYGRRHEEYEKDGATLTLAGAVADGAGQSPNPGVEWILSLLRQQEIGIDRIRNLCNNINFCLLKAMEDNIDISTRISLVEGSREILENICGSVPGLTELVKDLYNSYGELGNLYMKQGDMNKAAEYYEKLISNAAKILDVSPDNADYARDLTIGINNLGLIYLERGNLANAEECHNLALEIIGNLRSFTRDDLKYSDDLSVTYERLAYLNLLKGDLDNAIDYRSKVVDIAQQLHAKSPGNNRYTRTLAISFDNMGSLFDTGGRLDQALEYYDRCYKLLENLRRAVPDSAEYSRDMSICCRRTGDIYIKLGDLEKAEEYFNMSMAEAEGLCRRAPDSIEYARDLSICYERLGDLSLFYKRDLQKAAKNHKKCMEMRVEICKRAPDNTEYASNLALCYERLGDIYFSWNDLDSAEMYYENCYDINGGLCKNAPDNSAYRRAFSVGNWKMGDVFFRQGELEPAEKRYKTFLEMSRELFKQSDNDAMNARNLAIAYSKMSCYLVQTGKRDEAEEYLDLLDGQLSRMTASGMQIGNDVIGIRNWLYNTFFR